MALTREQITQELATDSRPNGPDGCSNIDRINFVCQVFGMATINLDAEYDWNPVVRCQDSDLVLAAKHLALLKLDLMHRRYYNHMMTEDAFNTQSSVLILGLQRINWHLSHLLEGRITPPFPSIH